MRPAAARMERAVRAQVLRLNVKTHVEVNEHIQKSLSIVKHAFEDQIAARDRVDSRGRLSFQHVGELNGAPPTNQVIEVSFIHIMRIKDGLNAEEGDGVDFLPLMKALEVVPEDAGIDRH